MKNTKGVKVEEEKNEKKPKNAGEQDVFEFISIIECIHLFTIL